jgi:hypothetical protein
MVRKTSDKDMRINIDIAFRERLEKIKEFYNIVNNSDMIRMLVSKEYHAIIEKEKTK